MLSLTKYKNIRGLTNIKPVDANDKSFTNKSIFNTINQMFSPEEWLKIVTYAYKVKDAKKNLKETCNPDGYKVNIDKAIRELKKEREASMVLAGGEMIRNLIAVMLENNEMLKEILEKLNNKT